MHHYTLQTRFVTQESKGHNLLNILTRLYNKIAYAHGCHLYLINQDAENSDHILVTELTNVIVAFPILEFFSIQVYIIPFNTQEPTIPYNMVETIKNTFIKLEDYNIVTKKIILTLYCHENSMQLNIKKVERHAYLLLLFTLGEVKYKKHIYDFNCEAIPQNTNGLLSLSELPEFIDYLAKINYSRKLKIFFE